MNPNEITIPLSYKIRVPEKITKNTASIFFLHGYGSNMNDLFSLGQLFPDEWAIISLQAPLPTGFGGWAWAELDYNNLKELPKPEQRYSSRDSIIESINTCVTDLNLDPSRVHLIGFSQGAAFTLFCGLTNPKMFHGLVALCGFIEYKKIKDEIEPRKVKNLNIFVGSGIIDEVIPIHLGRMTERGLRKLGTKPVYNEYNAGHTISNDCLNDLLGWIQSIQ